MVVPPWFCFGKIKTLVHHKWRQLKIVCWMSEGLSHCLTQASDRLCKDHDNEGGALVAAKILTF